MEEESLCSRNREEVLGAVQQLMQLSTGDDSGSNVVTAEKKKIKKKKRGGDVDGEEEVDQKRCQIEASIWSKIEEIFGKEDEDDLICRPKRRRSRFRSIQSIYMTTKPVVNRRFSSNGIIGT